MCVVNNRFVFYVGYNRMLMDEECLEVCKDFVLF